MVTQTATNNGGGHPDISPNHINLLHVLWRRKWIVLAVLVVAWALAAVLYFVVPPRYESTARLLVIKKGRHSVTSVDPRASEFETNLSVHQSVLTSPVVIRGAIDQRDLLSLPSLKSEAVPVELISESLFVEREKTEGQTDNNSAILTLAYRSTSPEDSPLVLTALIESYQKFLNRIHRFDNEATRDLFVKWKQEVEESLRDTQEQYRQLKADAAKLGVTERNSLDVPNSRLAELERERAAQSVRAVELEKKLNMLRDARQRGMSARGLAELASRWLPVPTSRTFLQQELEALNTEEQSLLAQYGANHPKLAAVQERIKQIQQQMTLSQTPSSESSDPLEDSLKQELTMTRDVQASINQLVDDARGELSTSVQYFENAELLRSEISMNREMYREIVRELQALDLVKDADVYNAEIIAQPDTGEKVVPSAPVLGIILTALGLVGGCGLAFLVEGTRKRIDSPQQLHRELGFSVVGQIPTFPTRGKAASASVDGGPVPDNSVCVFHRQESPAAEAYRSLRTALFFGTRHAETILITSPNAGDGKTTLAANLAVSIAKSGRSVLLVDADFRTPRLHQVFRLTNDLGSCSALQGTGSPNELVQATAVPQLSVLPCGPPPDNAAELFLLPEFKELLDVGRELYDYVILDGTHVLGQTDPCVIAPQVDGVLLAVRADSGLPQAARAAQILESMQANVLGVVMNRVAGRSLRDLGPYAVAHNGSGGVSTSRSNDGLTPVPVSNQMRAPR